MHSSNRWTMVALWLAIGGIAVLSAMLTRPAAHLGEEYFPVGNDSFYHAVRILEAAKDPGAFYRIRPKDPCAPRAACWSGPGATTT